MIELASSVYTADHGYAWSSAAGHPASNRPSPETLEDILAEALATRPDFADETAVGAGVIVLGGFAAAFTVRRAPHWDAEGRDSDYAAFAFVPCARADAIDFEELLKDDFFTTPTHTPRESLAYDGPASAAFPVDAPGRLLCHNRLDDFDVRALGALLAHYGNRADRWFLQLTTNRQQLTTSLTTSPWHR